MESHRESPDCLWEGWFCLLLGDLKKFLHISLPTSVEMRRCGDHTSHTAQILKSYKSTSLCASGCVQSRLCCHTSFFHLSVSLYAVGHYCHSQWTCFRGSLDVCSKTWKEEHNCAAGLPSVSILFSQIHTWHLFPAQHNKSVSTQGRGTGLFW